jgi:hypothetical protein
MLNDDVAMATVVDEQGEPLTSMAVEIEERRLLPLGKSLDGVATIVALGTSVSIYGSSEEFGESDDSLFLGTEDAEHWRLHPDEPPANYVAGGLQWPRRIGAESFGTYATFLDPGHAQASALMSGTVLSAERRTVIQTGQEIVIAEVRTAGGLVVTVCLEGAAHSGLPPIGGIISGTVNMVASMGSWHESPSTTVGRAQPHSKGMQ